MRSGIPAPDDDAVLAKVYDAPLVPAPSFDEEMRTYSALRSQFVTPNTVGVYTDFNYDLLASIAQKVVKEDIGTLITGAVIGPLHLKETLYPTETDLPGGLRGYGWNLSSKRFEDKTLFNPPLAGAAGAVISTVDDLHVFARAFCHGDTTKVNYIPVSNGCQTAQRNECFVWSRCCGGFWGARTLRNDRFREIGCDSCDQRHAVRSRQSFSFCHHA